MITRVAGDAPLLRMPLPADPQTGLEVPSWAAIDQLATIRRAHLSRRIGRLSSAKMIEISRAVVVFLGIADADGGTARRR